MKKIIARLSVFLLILGIIIAVVIAVKNGYTLKTGLPEDDGRFTVAMVTDGGGVNDLSFQQSAWEGMQRFAKRTNSRASYLESVQTADLQTNMDRFADEKVDLIWGMGFMLADAVKWAASVNPELNYAIADLTYGPDTPDNVTCAVFNDEESSFLAGYIAGHTTKTNAVGFIGGIQSVVIDRFEYGYRAGAAYAARELGKKIDVKAQYAESFTDVAKGKAIAQKMFSECDVVFHAAGGAGVGMIEAAKECGRFAIGVDLDQSHLAPKNILTSALKNTGMAVDIISTKLLEGEKIGGQTFRFGLKENCVGIPEKNPNMDRAVYKRAMLIKNKLIDAEFVAPGTPEAYNKFMRELPGLKI